MTPAQRMLLTGAKVRLVIHGTAWRLGGRSFAATSSAVEYEATGDVDGMDLPQDIRLEYVRNECPTLRVNDVLTDADGMPWRVIDNPFHNPGDPLASCTCRRLSE